MSATITRSQSVLVHRPDLDTEGSTCYGREPEADPADDGHPRFLIVPKVRVGTVPEVITLDLVPGVGEGGMVRSPDLDRDGLVGFEPRRDPEDDGSMDDERPMVVLLLAPFDLDDLGAPGDLVVSWSSGDRLNA